METIQWDMSTIANVIQLSVAPVFLLAGISALLGVMTNRLGRVIDRARVLQSRRSEATSKKLNTVIDHEMRNLLRRGRFINFAISFATISELLVCLVIMTLFLGSMISINFSVLVATLFIVCMLLLITALSSFLCEVLIATASMRAGLALSEAFIENE